MKAALLHSPALSIVIKEAPASRRSWACPLRRSCSTYPEGFPTPTAASLLRIANNATASVGCASGVAPASWDSSQGLTACAGHVTLHDLHQQSRPGTDPDGLSCDESVWEPTALATWLGPSVVRRAAAAPQTHWYRFGAAAFRLERAEEIHVL